MKRILTILVLAIMGISASAQQYSFTFKLDGCKDTMMYIARHYRDEFRLVDSTRLKGDSYVFSGKKQWPRGIYALVHQDGTKAVGDFAIDGSLQFTITGDSKLTPSSVTVKGSSSNQQMFSYMATVDDARQQMKDIAERKKNPATKEQAEADEKALVERMDAYEATARHPKNSVLFFDLVNHFESATVPDSIEDKATYFRNHYWDGILNSDKFPNKELVYTPNLFNKMNYFFFGVLYHSDSDTIIKAIDKLVDEYLADDTMMMRYFFDFIEPRYYRSTRNVGWDAVWCHLASEYYLKGRCPWTLEGTLYNMKYNYNRIRQSLIGAHGQELWMADTNQSDNPEDWISSHRFPEKYVILWFWDPDCHHCQKYSAELKVLYDSLKTAPDRRFEVYAVGYESDVPKWKKYIREHQLPFVHVGGVNVNIDYQEAYNIHSAPTMIILNEKRDIIMNKLIPIKSIIPFLDDYEKRMAAQSDKEQK